LFLTIALAVLGDDPRAIGKAQSYSRLYTELSKAAAVRTLRFWKLRRLSPST
jgi:hypothetical protein